MTTSGAPPTRDQLRAALLAAGIEADDRRLDELLPSYEGMRSGAARLRALDLGETEPAVIFLLPPPGPRA
jgi:hypothetical protein